MTEEKNVRIYSSVSSSRISILQVIVWEGHDNSAMIPIKTESVCSMNEWHFLSSFFFYYRSALVLWKFFFSILFSLVPLSETSIILPTKKMFALFILFVFFQFDKLFFFNWFSMEYFRWLDIIQFDPNDLIDLFGMLIEYFFFEIYIYICLCFDWY